MRSRLLATVMVTALVSLSMGNATTMAQSNPDIQLGSKIPVRPEKADPVRDGVVRDQYVRCAYGPYKEEIDQLLATSDPLFVDFDGAGISISKLTRRYTLRQCFAAEGEVVQSSISFSPSAFRYMMMEAAYKRKYHDIPEDYASRVAPIRRYFSSGQALGLARTLGIFSDCLAAQDPVGSDRLLRTGSGTDAERAAAQALVPALSACIIEGQEMKLTPANIRTFAADGMWQRFVAPFGEGE